MKQVCIINGGSTYEDEAAFQDHLLKLELKYIRMLYTGGNWKNWLGATLTDYDVLLPEMPNKAYAKYDEWALFFSKILPFLHNDAILVGHSLGGIFLAKYLNEHADSLHFSKVALVSAPFNDTSTESLASFALPEDMSNLEKTADHFALFHSTDDKVVPFAEIHKYAAILPRAEVTVLEGRGHINDPTFPELLEFIKK